MRLDSLQIQRENMGFLETFKTLPTKLVSHRDKNFSLTNDNCDGVAFFKNVPKLHIVL